MVKQVSAPARFVPQQAMALGQVGEDAVAVGPNNPIPVVARRPPAATSPAVAGATAASTLIGPFTPELDRPIWVTLSGTWAGSVEVQRSIDGGATRLPLTIAGQPWARFTGNAQEVVGEESSGPATYYLNVTLSSGTLAYRIAQ
ncbi:MAG TPA: hypothetical protein VJM34_08445 [Novosphingobium sp.]|nr:hypothetical protein [Novosphingobium sp.]